MYEKDDSEEKERRRKIIRKESLFSSSIKVTVKQLQIKLGSCPSSRWLYGRLHHQQTISRAPYSPVSSSRAGCPLLV